jgi:AcrR family transcriptional regulator
MDSKVGIVYIVVNVYIRGNHSMVPAARYHHGDLRAALVQRASEVVAAHGVDSLSLRELARDLGVSHGAPSRHFPDKQALLDALALNGFDRLRGVMVDALEQRPVPADFTAALTALAAAYVRFAVANPSLLAVMFAAKHRREAPAELRTAAEQAFAAPLRAIQDAQSRGEVVAAPVEDIATAILATMHGYAVLVAGGLFEHDETGQSLTGTLRRLVEGLRPR